MTLYLLIHEQDTDAAWGADVQVFLNATEAQKAMNAAYQETADRWNFDDQESDEEHMRTCSDSEATWSTGALKSEIWMCRWQLRYRVG